MPKKPKQEQRADQGLASDTPSRPARSSTVPAPIESPRHSDPGGASDASGSSNGDHGHRPSNRANHGHGHGHGNSVGKLALAALGVVYGDIGTSPLYALRECFADHNEHVPDAVHESAPQAAALVEATQHVARILPTPANVMGLLSLFFWSMTLVVTIKYIRYITRADNEGEGGILALLALVLPRKGVPRFRQLVVAGLFGAALLYADGMLTPAISVLSAVEGLRGIEGVGESLSTEMIVGISCVILLGLFMVQSRGTASVGAFFGPIMLVWFSTIAVLGALQIMGNPGVLWALSPTYAVQFFATNHWTGFFVLGSVVLCITGGEALYADMGHFGRDPIKWSWLFLVGPSLILNYFGQGALLLRRPELVEDSFFALAGDNPQIRAVLVVLATVATVIASQALISGAFSLTRQAITMGYLPRLEIRHTSSDHEGHIYVPEVNWILMVACLILVLIFQSSSGLAAAYGIAVTGTMAITTLLFYQVSKKWWGEGKALAICGVMLVIDLAFFSANFVKLLSGGWIPLAVAAVILATMQTWKEGRERVGQFLRHRSEPLDEFLASIVETPPPRVRGTAVVMTSSSAGTPPVLLHHFRHNQVLHEQIVLLSIVTDDVPFVSAKERVQLEELKEGFWRVTATYGFMQVPKVTDILKECDKRGLRTRPDSTSFYLGREKLVVTRNKGMSQWKKYVFSFLTKNARPATDFFKLPPDRVVELGMQLEL